MSSAHALTMLKLLCMHFGTVTVLFLFSISSDNCCWSKEWVCLFEMWLKFSHNESAKEISPCHFLLCSHTSQSNQYNTSKLIEFFYSNEIPCELIKTTEWKRLRQQQQQQQQIYFDVKRQKNAQEFISVHRQMCYGALSIWFSWKSDFFCNCLVRYIQYDRLYMWAHSMSVSRVLDGFWLM